MSLSQHGCINSLVYLRVNPVNIRKERLFQRSMELVWHDGFCLLLDVKLQKYNLGKKWLFGLIWDLFKYTRCVSDACKNQLLLESIWQVWFIGNLDYYLYSRHYSIYHLLFDLGNNLCHALQSQWNSASSSRRFKWVLPYVCVCFSKLSWKYRWSWW